MSLDEYNELIASKTFLGEQVRASELSASTSIRPPKAHMFGIARLTHQAAQNTFVRSSSIDAASLHLVPLCARQVDALRVTSKHLHRCLVKAEARGEVLSKRLHKAKQAAHSQEKLFRGEVGLWTCITH
jgi:hypothetical protein